jgi:hypothetical protein
VSRAFGSEGASKARLPTRPIPAPDSFRVHTVVSRATTVRLMRFVLASVVATSDVPSEPAVAVHPAFAVPFPVRSVAPDTDSTTQPA